MSTLDVAILFWAEKEAQKHGHKSCRDICRARKQALACSILQCSSHTSIMPNILYNLRNSFILIRTDTWESEWDRWKQTDVYWFSLCMQNCWCVFKVIFWRCFSSYLNIRKQQPSVFAHLLWLANLDPLYIPGTQFLNLKLQTGLFTQHTCKKCLILHCQFSNISIYSG